jgi:hypothetical protein
MDLSIDFRRLKKMSRGVPQAVSSRWRGVTIFGFVVLCLAEPVLARAQKTMNIPPLGSDQDAAGQAPEDASAPPPAGSTTTVATLREATWRKLPGNFLQDQKDMWLFPVKLAEGHHWLPTA